MGLFSLFKSSGMIYFPGDITYFKFRENYELYLKIFSKLGITVRVLDKQNSCGLVPLELGYESEARKLMRQNLEDFKLENIKKLITNSPECYKMFSENYSEMLPDWDVEVINIWELILDRLQSRPKLIKNSVMEMVCYHDSCYLARYSEICREPREILKLFGYEIKEFPDSKENSFCCGSCGGLNLINPKLANKIAKERILQAKRMGVKKIIVSSLANYEILKNNSEDIEILEFSEVLAIGLGIKKIEEELDSEVEENEIDNKIAVDKIDLKEEEEIRQEYYE